MREHKNQNTIQSRTHKRPQERSLERPLKRFHKRTSRSWQTVMLLLIFCICLLWPEQVHAGSGKTVIALGADLTAEQKQTVLELFGLTEEEYLACEVIPVTNAQEKAYLGGYLEDAVIGSRALSSVMLRPGREGGGINVTTRNINYCTAGMYRNALLTAGVKDVDVIVAAPFALSGTAALIGAIKAYERMEGQEIQDSVLRTSLEEMLITGTASETVKGAEQEAVEGLIAYVKGQVAENGLDTEEEILEAIRQGEKQFGVTLGEENVHQILGLMSRLKDMGLDSSYLIRQAEQLYEKYGDALTGQAEGLLRDAAGDLTGEILSGQGQGSMGATKKQREARLFQWLWKQFVGSEEETETIWQEIRDAWTDFWQGFL